MAIVCSRFDLADVTGRFLSRVYAVFIELYPPAGETRSSPQLPFGV